ncbi:hypothetical protein VCV18_012705 [Metarhizium anisopliae]
MALQSIECEYWVLSCACLLYNSISNSPTTTSVWILARKVTIALAVAVSAIPAPAATIDKRIVVGERPYSGT